MSRFHILTGEHGRFRRWTLYIFARYVEMPLLAWSYRLLRGCYQRLGRNRLVRTVLGWLVAAPFGLSIFARYGARSCSGGSSSVIRGATVLWPKDRVYRAVLLE